MTQQTNPTEAKETQDLMDLMDLYLDELEAEAPELFETPEDFPID